MYWLVEDEEQLNVLINSGYKEAFIEVIPYSNNTHPTLNKISLIYIRPINASKGFIVCVTHSECLNVLNTRIDTLISKFDVLYCRDKKEMLHYFPNKTLYDINRPPTTYIRPTTKAHEIMYRKYEDNSELNAIIPIVKHYELCETIFEDLKANINKKKQNIMNSLTIEYPWCSTTSREVEYKYTMKPSKNISIPLMINASTLSST